MMSSKKIRSRRPHFHTLKELRHQKSKVRKEILETEDEIKGNYRSLVDALTFRNIVNAVAEEIIATNMIISQAYSIIRPLFNRKKKKKRIEKQEARIEEISD